jgi:hypothetical protein
VATRERLEPKVPKSVGNITSSLPDLQRPHGAPRIDRWLALATLWRDD